MAQTFKSVMHKAKHYYLTHDGIEMFLFACIWAFLGWSLYHFVIGLIGRFM